MQWSEVPVRPRCGETERLKHAGGKSTRPGVINCNPCRKPFTVTVGTTFEDSKTPRSKWLLGIRLMAGSKKGIGARQLHCSLDITCKSGWFMAHRIRDAMDIDNGPPGLVAALETRLARVPANLTLRQFLPLPAWNEPKKLGARISGENIGGRRGRKTSIYEL